MTGPVFMLSRSVPPARSGAATVVDNLARQFTRGEMVLAGEGPWDRPVGHGQRDGPELVYVIRGWPPAWRGARWWRWLQFPLMLWRCVRLVRRRRCAAILVVFPKAEFLLTAYLTAVWTGARLFPYMHNTYVENRRGLSRLVARCLQHLVFRRAEQVFVMSDGMLELYRQRYPALACSVLPHSFNGEPPAFTAPPPLGSPVRLVLGGNINASCQEATTRVCRAVRDLAGVSLTIASATPRVELERDGVLCDGVGYETPPDLLARLRAADIVVLPHGFTGGHTPDEYRTIFPTRTIDYLLSGRAILAHAPADCFLTRFLTQRRCALIVDHPSEEAVQAGIRRLGADGELRAQLVRNALAAAELFRASRVAATLRAQLQHHRDATASRRRRGE